MRVPCPLPGCKALLVCRPPTGRASLRQKIRSAVRSHLGRHYELGTRDRSLLCDEAVEGL